MALGVVVSAMVMGEPPFFQNQNTKPSTESESEKAILAAGSATRLTNTTAGDTTRPPSIEAKPCSVHATYRNREQAFLPYRPVRQDVVPSLHEFTCRWAVGNNLSLDPQRLPEYVRPVGDSLELEDGTLVYAVEMVELKEKPSSTLHKLYFVADVRDSLYYQEIDHAAPHHPGTYFSRLRVRSVRPLEVPKAETQYIWFEYAKLGEKEKNNGLASWEEWKAHIFTYDRSRGFRHLQWTPIRKEVQQNGKLIGAKQWDVSVPEAGVMLIEPRLQKGKDLTLEPPEHWIGTHVIDSSATDVDPRPSRH